MRERWITLRPWVALAIRLALGAMFLLAGWLKLFEPQASVNAVRAYRLLPEAIVPVIGYGLPPIEILLGVVLLVGLVTRIGAIVSAVLMLVFIIGISSAAARGLSIDCGCFGSGGQVGAGETSYTVDLIRDGAALAGSVFLAIWPRSRLALDSVVNRFLHPSPTRKANDE